MGEGLKGLKADNNSNDKSIIVKIDGEERPYYEETVIHDWKKGTEEASATVSEEEGDEEFSWVLPKNDSEEIPEFHQLNVVQPEERKQYPFHWRKASQPGLSRMIIAICLAIPVGLMFGLLILNLFIQPDTTPAIVDNSQTATTSDNEVETANDAYTATLPSLQIPVVQAGAFSSGESADQRIDELDLLGYTAIRHEINETHYVYIGVTGNLEQAKQWQEQLQNDGIEDVWAKEITLPEKVIQLPSETEGQSLVEDTKVFYSIANELGEALTNGQVNEETLTTMTEAINRSPINAENEIASQLQTSLQDALQALITYQTSPENAVLSHAQKSLLQYIAIYSGESV